MSVTEEQMRADLAEMQAAERTQMEMDYSEMNGQDPRQRTSPMPTGVKEIDKAGQRIGKRFSRTLPTLDDRSFDDPLLVRKQRADEGVDMTSGMPLVDRANVAMSPPLKARRAARIQETMQGFLKDVPDDMPKFRWDGGLGEFQFNKPQGDGTFRWTSMVGTGIELGDLGDMMNPGEIFSMVGGVVGAGKAKMFTFGRSSSPMLGGFSGGLSGRAIGDGISLMEDYLRNDYVPTKEDFQELGWNGLQIEAFASISGELGAKILRGMATGFQDLSAVTQGKQGVFGDPRTIELENKNLRQTQEDLARISTTLGRNDLPVTQGTATHSIDLIESEAFGIANASKQVQRDFKKAEARGKRTMQDYINAVFGGNERFLGTETPGIVLAANDAIKSSGRFVIAQTDDGLIHMRPKSQPNDAALGLKMRDNGEFWDVKGASLRSDQIDMTGAGIGKDMYMSAAAEAATWGKVLRSDIRVRPQAEKVWKSIDGKEGIGRLKWNKTKFYNERSGYWETRDELPLVEMVKPESFTRTLLDNFKQPGVGKDGKIVADKEFKRFIRAPLKGELGEVVADMQANPFVRQEMKEAILEDYTKNVAFTKPDGSTGYRAEAFETWKEETGRVLEEVFTAKEMMEIRKTGGMTNVVRAGRDSMDRYLDNLRIPLGVSRDSMIFSDPSQKRLWNQLKTRSPAERVRVMKLLDIMGGGGEIRSLFKEELRLDLLSKTKGANNTGFDVWRKNNDELIRNVLDTYQSSTGRAMDYMSHLKTVGNVLKRRSDRAMVVGSGADANPTGLALTRVLFGPLSRAQRGFSAIRRTQVRMTGAQAADIIVDPNALRELTRIRAFPVESRQVAKVIQDLGLAEPLGFVGVDGESFDANNEDHRQQVARLVMIQLQGEELEEE